MSHHNNHLFLIIVLFVLFPGVFVALGIGYVLFYILIGVIYLIYMYFVPIFIVGIIIFILYALSKKQNNKKTLDNTSEAITKQAPLPAGDRKPFNTEYDDIEYHNFERGNEEADEETTRLMEEHDLDQDDAEKVQEIAEEWGIDEDEAVELLDDL